MPFDLGKYLKLAGMIAGAIAGITLLAFIAGFMAQRAQFQFAQVPFVFYDYGAYVETGVMGVLRSLYLLLGKPLPVILIAAVSIAVILLLEFEWFRKLTMRPYLAFGIYVLVVAFASVVLQQQFSVCALAQAGGPSPLIADSAGNRFDDTKISPPDYVPLIWPFTLFVSQPMSVDRDDLAEFPDFDDKVTSDDLWRVLANEIDSRKSVGARYFEVRPNPVWALTNSNAAEEGGSMGPLLGFHVEERDLEHTRALKLYRSVTAAILFGIWAVGLLVLWQRHLHEYMADSTPPNPSPAGSVFDRIEVLLVRFQEELWFSAQWILRPVALLLVGAQLVLLPECFGILAMPKLGQEFVEVATVRTESDELINSAISKESSALSREGLSPNEIAETGEIIQESVDSVINIATEYASEEHTPAAKEFETKWRDILKPLEKQGDPEATQALKSISEFANTISPTLAGIAYEAWTRAAARTSSSKPGFLLYYPRSENDHVRMLEADFQGRGWSIRQASVSESTEFKINSDQKSIAVVGALRRMPTLSGDDRGKAFLELELLGHPNNLEIAMAGTYDFNNRVAGHAITAVGRYAAGLSESRFDHARSARAARHLLNLVRATDRRADHRGAAASSLYFFVKEGDDEVARTLLAFIQDPDTDNNDPDWVVRGAVITTIGKLRIGEATGVLTSYLEPTSPTGVPERVLASIPSVLATIGEREKSVPAIARVVQSVESPDDLLGTAISALGLLPQLDNELAINVLGSFLARVDHPRVTPERLSEQLQPAAVDALRNLGDRYAIEYLTPLIASDSNRSNAIRGRAIMALGELRDTESQERLLELCESDSEPVVIRAVSLGALTEFGDFEAIQRVYELSQSLPTQGLDSSLRIACLEFFIGRASAGSSEASGYARELGEELENLPSSALAELGRAIESGDDSEEHTSEDGGLSDLLKRLMEESTDRKMVDSFRISDGKLVRVGSRVSIKKPEDETEGPGWVSDMAQYLSSPLTVSALYEVEGNVFFDAEESVYTWDVRWIESSSDESDN